jgi:hypothetical protein
LIFRFPAKTLAWFVPFAALPILALMTAQYAEFGQFKLAYEDFGTEAYLFEGSLWKTPLELDALNVPWLDPEEAARRGIVGESYGLYLFHMTFGHHGFWSLTPIFLFSAAGMIGLLRGAGKLAAALAVVLVLAGLGLWGVDLFKPSLLAEGGALRPYLWSSIGVDTLQRLFATIEPEYPLEGAPLHSYFWLGGALAGLTMLLGLVIWLTAIKNGGKPMAAVAWMTLTLTLVLLAFYTWNPKARNYGGSTEGLRWLFWLIPFWLLMLPSALDAIADRPWLRKLAVLALFASILSIGYAMRGPWSNPWIQDMLEHLGLYSLRR